MVPNPAHHPGALAIYCFWIALVTGIYLFIFYETSLSGAWRSVERLTHDQWMVGGLMRSLHRYASAGAVLFIVWHVIREWARGHHRGARWFSWVTGVPLAWIVIAFGISGYWLVWDELAQYIAVSTARLMDWLPVFTDPMSRNFQANDSVSDRFFTLIAFIHLVGLPIILVLGVWFHLLRVRLPRINPPRALMAQLLGAFVALSLLMPAVSHAPADLSRVPARLAIDWFYLGVYPLQSATSPALAWTVLAAATVLLAAAPFIMAPARPAPAEVHLPDCSGCGYCAEDCPYGAIDMVPRTDGRAFALEARVDASMCVGCGICTGSCPSSSPFRRTVPLRSGIEMPGFTLESLRRSLLLPCAGERPATVVLGCMHGVDVGRLAIPGVHGIALPCAGALPPAAMDFALRVAGFERVVVSTCRIGDCHNRYGNVWTAERMERVRPPSLRERVPRGRITTLHLGADETDRLERAVRDPEGWA